MTPERKHHLTVTYIEPLKASEPFMESAKRHVTYANAREFCGLCREAVRDRAATRKEGLPTDKERAFIVLSLWNAAGGTTAELIDNLTSANILLPYLKKLAAEEKEAWADTPTELQEGKPEGATHYRQGSGYAKWYRQHPTTNEWEVWVVDAWSRSSDIMRGKLDPATLIPTQPNPTQQEPQTMDQTTPAFETKHYVYGVDVANMSSGQLIEAIKKLEAEIADLKGVKAESEHIKKRIAELEGMLVKIVEVLDAK